MSREPGDNNLTIEMHEPEENLPIEEGAPYLVWDGGSAWTVATNEDGKWYPMDSFGERDQGKDELEEVQWYGALPLRP